MSRNLIARAAALAAVMLCAHATQAQDRDPAAAEALFTHGRELMNAQRYAEACLQLAESQRLDPGIGTQFHLAGCYEHEGKLASAWAAFREVASLATASGQQDRAAAASRRAALLEPRLPRLKVVVPVAARSAGLEITRDGVVVGEAQWDAALPIDPGDHRLEVTAPGKRVLAAVVHASEGNTTQFEIPPLESTKAGETATPLAPAPVAAPVAAPAPLPPAPQPPPVRDTQSEASSSGPGALVITLGIVGVAGIGAGTVLGLMASAKNKDSKEHCPISETECDATGVSLRDQAFKLSDFATVGFIAGGAALATAGILWLVRGHSASSTAETAFVVHAAPGAAGATLRGRF